MAVILKMVLSLHLGHGSSDFDETDMQMQILIPKMVKSIKSNQI